jgi:cysteine-S-conjugate beta-lyase
MARRHGLLVDPSWVSATPGIVSGLDLILQAVSSSGDEVVVFPPAYHAFRRIILANERRILDAQLLIETDGRYSMNLKALRAQLTPRTKVVFLCSPHNPGGTVWSAAELRACQSAPNRDPGSASKRDPTFLRFDRLALAPSDLVGVAETAGARVGV